MFSEYVSNVFFKASVDSLTGIYPRWTGFLKATPEYVCKPRVLDDYYFLYLSSGSGSYKCKNKEYAVGTGDMFFLFPGVIHSYITNRDDLMEQWWVGFNGPAAGTLLQKLDVNPDNPVIRNIKDENVPDEIRYIVRKCPEAASFDFFKACGSIYKIFGMLLFEHSGGRAAAKAENGYSGAVRRAVGYIEANYPHDITIGRISEDCCLSRAHFATKFKKETGMPPSEYLSTIRLNRAREYLAGSDMAVMEIAYSVGFNDAHYFSRLFRKREGLTPGEFRRQNRRK